MSINVSHPKNGLKEKNQMITSINVEKAFDKIHYLCMILFKTQEKIGIEGNFLSLIKVLQH
jgi:hypothetical protein